MVGFRKRQIVYKALPEEIQKSVDAEIANNQLRSYEEFIDFCQDAGEITPIIEFASSQTTFSKIGS